MARLTLRFSGPLLDYVRRRARKTDQSEARVVRNAVHLHEYMMGKVDEGMQIMVYNPSTEIMTPVDLSDL